MSNTFYIGIDFGTTYSVVSYFENKPDSNPVIVPNSLGDSLIPSTIVITKDFKFRFGSEANTIKEGDIKIEGIKRLLGKSYKELISDVEFDLLPYELIEDEKTGKAKIKVQNKTFLPQELVAMFLKKIIPEIENYINKEIKKAIFTIPAIFNENQRNALIEAANIAGIQVEKTLLEPTAAAIFYGYNSKIKPGKKKNLLIFDLGGGTLDITILNFEIINDKKRINIVNTMGNSLLGGIDFDEEILKLLKNELEKNNINYNELDNQTKIRIRKACENAKKQLSDKLEVKIKLKNISKNVKNFEMNLTRKKFEDISENLFKKCKELISMSMKNSTIGINEIDEVILIGGSTKIPKIREVISNFIKKPVYKSSEINFSYYAVAKGASIELSREIYNFDVINYNIGVLYDNNYQIIFSKNDSLPISDINEYDFNCTPEQNTFLLKFYKGNEENYLNNDYIGDFSINFLGTNNINSTKNIIITYKINPKGIFSVEGYEKDNRSVSNFVEFTSTTSQKLSNSDLPAPPVDELNRDNINLKSTILLSSVNFKSDSVLESNFKQNKCSYFNEPKESSKIIYNNEIINPIEQILSFNKLNNANKDIYVMLVKELFQSYNNYEELNKNKNLDNIKKNIYKYLTEIINYQEFNILEFIEIFDIDKELYNFCLLFLIKDYYIKAQKRYKEGNKELTKKYCEAAINDGKKIKGLKGEYKASLNKIIEDCNNLCK